MLIWLPVTAMTLGLAIAAACGPAGSAGSAGSTGPAPAVAAGAGAARPEDPAIESAAVRLGWLAGHWVRADADADADAGRAPSETWVPGGSSLLGVGLAAGDRDTRFFEVMLATTDERGGVVLTAIPNGQRAVVFGAVEIAPGRAVFANPDHDDPREIRYSRAGDTLEVRLVGAAGDRTSTWRRAPLAPADALEAADRAFATDSATRGAAAWVDAFEPAGAMWTRRSGRVEAGEPLGAVMRRALDSAAMSWEPLASGLSPAGDLGFTIGRYQWGRRLSDGRTETLETGSYCTMWRRQPGGVWRVAFDAGAPD